MQFTLYLKQMYILKSYFILLWKVWSFHCENPILLSEITTSNKISIKRIQKKIKGCRYLTDDLWTDFDWRRMINARFEPFPELLDRAIFFAIVSRVILRSVIPTDNSYYKCYEWSFIVRYTNRSHFVSCEILM